MNEDKLLTAGKFAVASDMGITTVYRYIKQGKIQFVTKKLGTRSIKMIPKSELKKFK